MLCLSARHAQLQVNDELIAQHVEKVAQRRVDARNEKIKSARKARFDLKSNPFFSRPSESISKEFARLQQEQQQQLEQQRVLISSPTHMAGPSQSHASSLSTEVSATQPEQSSRPTRKASPIRRKLYQKKTKKLQESTDDDDESGTPASPTNEGNVQMPNRVYPSSPTGNKRPVIKSASHRPLTTTDAVKIGSIKTLKLIFPATYKSRYRHLLILDKIAYVYIQLVVMLGHKTMTGGQFRSFAR